MSSNGALWGEVGGCSEVEFQTSEHPFVGFKGKILCFLPKSEFCSEVAKNF
jgi:hypothetical protein